MARQRRVKPAPLSHHHQHQHQDLSQLDAAQGSCHSAKGSNKSSSRRLQQRPNQWCPTVLYVTCAAAVVVAVIYFLYVGYVETRVNTPIASPKVVTRSGLDVPERYWGTYRPGVYFGTRTRHPTSLLTGLMWFVSGHFQNNFLALRHWCDQADELSSYGWQLHDGRDFGVQSIEDKHVSLRTMFVKQQGGLHGGEWSVRIHVLPKSKKQVGTEASIIYYVALDPEDEWAWLHAEKSNQHSLGAVRGSSSSVGEFHLSVNNHTGTITRQHLLVTKHLGLSQLKETVMKGLRAFQGQGQTEKHIGLAGHLFDHQDSDPQPNFVAVQVSGPMPFSVDVAFESSSASPERQERLTGEALTRQLHKHEEKFHADFEAKFSLEAKGFSQEGISFAKAALSNMLGGIAYFYGSSRVLGQHNSEPVPYWRAPLYTAVPSRSFFPRGFLWDEGFHNLLISKWDREISQDILAHWLDLMNWDGWIPREQILGTEARARVPDEFVVQDDRNANPPTLLLTLHSMLAEFKEELSDDDYHYLTRLWPRLRAWYSWFNTTQNGDTIGTYRWRGRNPDAVRELNPKTLTSGLDDYPRASHPTREERHLDLRCWMTLASGLMADLARLVEKDPTRFLSDSTGLDALHWSYAANGYMDYGLHTDQVELRRAAPNSEYHRVTLQPPHHRHVDAFGYVTFFPLLLQVIDPHSPKLGQVLQDLRRTDLLWTPYGLRSLAPNAPLYNRRNTPHDPPYWRGSIWINMNYLAVRALHHYANHDGPHSALASQLYVELRKNVINNVKKQYTSTGYLWENYNDRTGKGQGCRPFTGWTSLVVLMMGETY
ncbi:Mannosyl-oligosaccharide glucosidase [Chionoecetes opilio]|uniref:Mannosyl-oligosaccharide glucosidase n=1 Tax=Chionoecetes opilio TaxID=41210 RepID=A0A8J4YQK9_CHIOP|nr:Mannosyl-oligosaccharide glucosidase [Chionoecetes opilio]